MWRHHRIGSLRNYRTLLCDAPTVLPLKADPKQASDWPSRPPCSSAGLPLSDGLCKHCSKLYLHSRERPAYSSVVILWLRLDVLRNLYQPSWYLDPKPVSGLYCFFVLRDQKIHFRAARPKNVFTNFVNLWVICNFAKVTYSYTLLPLSNAQDGEIYIDVRLDRSDAELSWGTCRQWPTLARLIRSNAVRNYFEVSCENESFSPVTQYIWVICTTWKCSCCV